MKKKIFGVIGLIFRTRESEDQETERVMPSVCTWKMNVVKSERGSQALMMEAKVEETTKNSEL